MRTILTFLLIVTALGGLRAQPNGRNDEYRYRRLEGTVGTQPVVMHLHEVIIPPLAGEPAMQRFSGVYYYQKYEAPIDFWGEVQNGSEIVLSESSPNESPTLRLRRQGSDRFTGTWTSANGAKTLAVELRENYPPGSVRFTSGTLRDEKKMFPRRDLSPLATVSVSWLEPAGDVDKPAREFLFDAVAHTLIHDSINGRPCCATPQAAFQHLRDEHFREYPGELANDVSPDSIEQFFMYNNDYDVQAVVVYNDNQRLSLGYTTSMYTGGAHGNYATDYYVYDLAKRRVLQLADLIKPGQEKAIEAALNRAARRRAGLKANEKLDSYYFVESMPVTENFYVTGKGIVFSYPPYEVSSYADGQVELFVPFAEIRESLK
jgi:hypothetical protein